MTYESTYAELVRRIREIAKTDPGILSETDPWRMFDHGLKTEGLDPSLAQATFACRLCSVALALREAKRLGPLP